MGTVTDDVVDVGGGDVSPFQLGCVLCFASFVFCLSTFDYLDLIGHDIVP